MKGKIVLFATFLFFLLCLSTYGMGESETYTLDTKATEWQGKIAKLRIQSFVYGLRDFDQAHQSLCEYQAILKEISDSSLDGSAKDYLTALIHFDLFSLYFDYFQNVDKGSKKDKEAYAELMKAQELVDRLLAAKVIFADLLRLKGEINLRMLAFVGMAGGGMIAVDLSNSAKRFFERTLALDPKNKRATLNLGTWYLFAPAIAGGNPRIAIRLFEEAASGGDDYVKFMSGIWKIMAYYSYMQQPENAKTTLDTLLQWLPTHGWLLDLKERMSTGRPLSAWS